MNPSFKNNKYSDYNATIRKFSKAKTLESIDEINRMIVQGRFVVEERLNSEKQEYKIAQGEYNDSVNILVSKGYPQRIIQYKTLQNLNKAVVKKQKLVDDHKDESALNKIQDDLERQLRFYGLKVQSKKFSLRAIGPHKKYIKNLEGMLEKYNIHENVLVEYTITYRRILKDGTLFDFGRDYADQVDVRTYNMDGDIKKHLEKMAELKRRPSYDVVKINIWENSRYIAIKCDYINPLYVPMQLEDTLQIWLESTGRSVDKNYKYCALDYILGVMEKYRNNKNYGIKQKLNRESLFDMVKEGQIYGVNTDKFLVGRKMEERKEVRGTTHTNGFSSQMRSAKRHTTMSLRDIPPLFE